MLPRNARNYFGDLPDVTLAPDMLTLATHILATVAVWLSTVQASGRSVLPRRMMLSRPAAR